MENYIFLIIIICLIVLFIRQSRFKSRLSMLEKQLKEFRHSQPQSDAPRPPALDYPIGPLPARGDVSDAGFDSAPERKMPLAARTEDRATKTLPETKTFTSPTSDAPPRAFVFNADKIAALSNWLRENWVLAIAAASLAFAGVFMVQYGVEHGLLKPFWRVIASLSFGTVLIAAGEWIRRFYGDGDGATAFLPSTLSGSGLIALFAGILSARVLYDLISPGTALAGLCGVAVVATVLGWFYGPVLAAVGIIGATTAPFLVGGDSDTPWVFYYYFMLIAVAGLTVDTIRRWAWVSALVLIATLGAMALLNLGDAGALHFVLAVFMTSFAALTLPARTLLPNHSGVAFADLLTKRTAGVTLPEFPTRVAFGAFAFGETFT